MKLIAASQPPFTVAECLLIEYALMGTMLFAEDDGALPAEIDDAFEFADHDLEKEYGVDRRVLVEKLSAMSAIEERVVLERLQAASLLRDQDPTLSHKESHERVGLTTLDPAAERKPTPTSLVGTPGEPLNFDDLLRLGVIHVSPSVVISAK